MGKKVEKWYYAYSCTRYVPDTHAGAKNTHSRLSLCLYLLLG